MFHYDREAELGGYLRILRGVTTLDEPRWYVDRVRRPSSPNSIDPSGCIYAERVWHRPQAPYPMRISLQSPSLFSHSPSTTTRTPSPSSRTSTPSSPPESPESLPPSSPPSPPQTPPPQAPLPAPLQNIPECTS